MEDYALAELTSEATSLLKSLIEIPSLSKQETQAADFLQHQIESCGIATGRALNNVWCLSPNFDLKKPTILLNSHIDTVKPAASWTRKPFVTEQVGNFIYGLGSNDAGASVVSLFATFQALTTCDQAYNLIFLASAEEEISGINGISHALNLLPPITFAIVGEPTEMQPAVAEKGLIVLDCVVLGKSGHAARNEGVNAIYEALPAIEWFKNPSFESSSDFLGSVKTTVTEIKAGTQHNVIPDECSFVVDIRTNECYTNQQVVEQIQKALPNIQITPRSIRLNSSQTPLNHPFVKRAIDLGLLPFGSPTLSDQALMPFPSVKIGPGKSSRSHTADEYILESEIKAGIKIYYQLLNGLTL